MAKYPIRNEMPKTRPAPKPSADKRTPREEREKDAMQKKYPFNKYAAGGLTKQMPTSNSMGNLNMAKGGGVEKKGKTKITKVKMAGGGKCYAKGGSIDGIASRGKTRCKGAK